MLIGRREKEKRKPSPRSFSLPGCSFLRRERVTKSHLEAAPGLDPSAPASAAKNREENADVEGENQPPITSIPLLPPSAPRPLLLLWAIRWP